MHNSESYQIKIGQKQKSRLWVHVTPILEVILATLTVNTSAITYWHSRASEIHTTPENSCKDTLPCTTWHQNYPSIFTCWWKNRLVAPSMFSLLTTRQHSAARKLIPASSMRQGWPQWTPAQHFNVMGIYHNFSPRNSPRQSAIAEGFAEANSVFIVITSAKILPYNF